MSAPFRDLKPGPMYMATLYFRSTMGYSKRMDTNLEALIDRYSRNRFIRKGGSPTDGDLILVNEDLDLEVRIDQVSGG